MPPPMTVPLTSRLPSPRKDALLRLGRENQEVGQSRIDGVDDDYFDDIAQDHINL